MDYGAAKSFSRIDFLFKAFFVLRVDCSFLYRQRCEGLLVCVMSPFQNQLAHSLPSFAIFSASMHPLPN